MSALVHVVAGEANLVAAGRVSFEGQECLTFVADRIRGARATSERDQRDRDAGADAIGERRGLERHDGIG